MLISYQAKPHNCCYHFVIVETQIAYLYKLYTVQRILLVNKHFVI